jgi:AhpC/TSA family
MLNQGDLAPDFTLPDQDGRPVRLSDLQGRRVVLYFYTRAEAAASERSRAVCSPPLPSLRAMNDAAPPHPPHLAYTDCVVPHHTARAARHLGSATPAPGVSGSPVQGAAGGPRAHPLPARYGERAPLK